MSEDGPQIPYDALCGADAPPDERPVPKPRGFGTFLNEGRCSDRNSAQVYRPSGPENIRHRVIYGGQPNMTWDDDNLRVLIISSPKMGTGGLFNCFWNTGKSKVDWVLRSHEIESMTDGRHCRAAERSRQSKAGGALLLPHFGTQLRGWCQIIFRCVIHLVPPPSVT